MLPYITCITSKFYPDKDEALSEAGWVIMRIIEKADKFNTKYSPVSYIHTMARNYCIDEYRKKSNRTRIEGDKKKTGPQEAVFEHNVEFLLDDAISKQTLELAKYIHIDQLDKSQIAELTGQTEVEVTNSIKNMEYEIANYIFE